ncbi:MAG: hypothetical protein H6908_03140 [Hyphomicrobiales bacterium]|nr:hypothetical protein [Rickettsiales bacterium]MCP5361625.1 hypothetical protein [Hyphomicrobiales bacterium]
MTGFSIHTDVSLNKDFTASAALPKKKKGRKKRMPPVSVRFSKEERARLEEEAAGMALSTYIKAVVLDDEHKPRKSRNANPAKDYQKLAVALAMLGQLDPLTTLTDFLNAIEDGSVTLPDDIRKEVVQACADIRLIRKYLILALGVKAED